MRFAEINLFGVYVAPISVIMVAAWVATIALRRFAARFGLLRYVWHPSLVCVRRLHDRAVVDGFVCRTMTDAELRSREEVAPGTPAQDQPRLPSAGSRSRRRVRVLPLLVTVVAVALAAGLGRAMWHSYMATPWTRDGTVRVYVVTMAPQVAGQIVQLQVADNQLVHKGDLLMVIDPTDYKIAVESR